MSLSGLSDLCCKLCFAVERFFHYMTGSVRSPLRSLIGLFNGYIGELDSLNLAFKTTKLIVKKRVLTEKARFS